MISPLSRERVLALTRPAPVAPPVTVSPAKSPPEEFLTRKQVAERFQTCCHTIMRWERRGLLTARRINQRVLRYPKSEIERLLQKAR